MRHLPRILAVASLLYLLGGAWWVIELLQSPALFEQVKGYLYAVPLLLAAIACLAVFRRWMKLARTLVLIALAPALFVVYAKGLPVIGFPFPLRLPLVLGPSWLDQGVYGIGVEIIPALLFTAAWYLLKPAPQPDPAATSTATV